MTLVSRLAAFCFVLVLTGGGGAGQMPAGSGQLGAVHLRSVRLDRIDDRHVGLLLDLSVTASRTISVKRLVLRDLRLNGIPVLAQPLDHSFSLTAGRPVDLPPLQVSVFFRDLRDTGPLREMLERGSAEFRGDLIADVRLSFLEMLAVRSFEPRFFVAFSEEAPLSVAHDGGKRRAALALLSLVELALRGDAKLAAHFPGLGSTWSRDLGSAASANLVEVVSTYEVGDRQGQSAHPIAFTQLGFRLPPGIVVGTAEVAAPWAYDPDLLAHIALNEVRLGGGAIVAVRPVVGGEAAGGGARASVESRGTAATETLLVGDGRTRIMVRERASPGAYTVLRTQGGRGSSPGWRVVPREVESQEQWARVAVFRLVGGQGDRPPRVDVVELSAKRAGNSLQLSEAVDASAFGSPILTPEGVLGIVEDEHTGAFVSDELRVAKRAAPVPHR